MAAQCVLGGAAVRWVGQRDEGTEWCIVVRSGGVDVENCHVDKSADDG
jgi:hypothetical protein